jgi:hypothetical protein
MNQLKRRATYQYGTLSQETRQRGPDVWAYRHFELVDGGKRRRKTIVGTVEQYPTRAAAERACECVRLVANAENLNPQSPTMRGLIDRYIGQVLRGEPFVWRDDPDVFEVSDAQCERRTGSWIRICVRT